MKHATPKAATQGFTIVEMILVVSIMAVLAGLTATPLLTFMEQRDKRTEETALIEIRKAMSAYLEERRTLPSDVSSTAWAYEFAGYTNMSPRQMIFDTWSRPRIYRTYVSQEFLLGTQMPIYYASVHSSGYNRSADASTGGIPVTTAGADGLRNFEAASDTGWWSKRPDVGSGEQAARIAAFGTLASGGDDMMVKLSDYAQKIEAYKVTLERLKRLGEALDSYSKTAYATYSTVCPGTTCGLTPEQKVYFPHSATGPEAVADDANLYTFTTGDTDVERYNGNNAAPLLAAEYINNGTNNSTRRTHMINLMRILGLPDEYCCSALDVIPGTTDPLTGKPQEMPFYYFSNPRPRLPTNPITCAARPTAAQRKLPARVTTGYINSGTANQTPTCG